MRRVFAGARPNRVLFTFLAVAAIVAAPAIAMQGAEQVDDRPVLLAAEPAPQGANDATTIQQIELVDATQSGAVELVIHADGGVPYEVFELSSPDRLVFDLPGLRAPESIEGVEIGESGIVRARLGQYREEPALMARVVLDLEQPVAWEASQQGNDLHLRLAPEGFVWNKDETAKTIETATAAPVIEAPAPIAAATTVNEPAEIIEPVETAAVAEEKTVAETTEWQTADGWSVGGEESTVEAPTNDDEAQNWTESEIADVIESAAGLSKNEETTSTIAAPKDEMNVIPLPSSETKMIEDTRVMYTGRPITTNLVDADIKQVFSLFHEISGLNFVLDPSVGGTVTIVVDNVPWDQALDLILKNNGLGMVMEGNVIRIAPLARLAQEAQARKALNEAKELEDPPVTITRTLSYAKAKDVERIVREAIISDRGRVIVDERTNTLIIRDVPNRVDATDSLLSTLDAETPQVMIEARIVEVSRDFVKDLGIQWGFTADADPALGTQTGLDFPHRANIGYDLNLPRNPAASALGFSFGNVLDSFTLDITIDALETEGYARRLSAPKIATQNNEPAEIEQGVRIPVVSTTATEIDVRFVSASLRLRVTPQITAEGTVVLEVEVENNSPDFVNTVDDVPAINTQRAQTTMLIDDNGTTVIGGIFQVNEGKSEAGVPFFRKIPVLGWLFKSRNEQVRNRELLIFLTPRIIKAS